MHKEICTQQYTSLSEYLHKLFLSVSGAYEESRFLLLFSSVYGSDLWVFVAPSHCILTATNDVIMNERCYQSCSCGLSTFFQNRNNLQGLSTCHYEGDSENTNSQKVKPFFSIMTVWILGIFHIWGLSTFPSPPSIHCQVFLLTTCNNLKQGRVEKTICESE